MIIDGNSRGKKMMEMKNMGMERERKKNECPVQVSEFPLTGTEEFSSLNNISYPKMDEEEIGMKEEEKKERKNGRKE